MKRTFFSGRGKQDIWSMSLALVQSPCAYHQMYHWKGVIVFQGFMKKPPNNFAFIAIIN